MDMETEIDIDIVWYSVYVNLKEPLPPQLQMQSRMRTFLCVPTLSFPSHKVLWFLSPQDLLSFSMVNCLTDLSAQNFLEQRTGLWLPTYVRSTSCAIDLSLSFLEASTSGEVPAVICPSS